MPRNAKLPQRQQLAVRSLLDYIYIYIYIHVHGYIYIYLYMYVCK